MMIKSKGENANMQTPSRVETAPSKVGTNIWSRAAVMRSSWDPALWMKLSVMWALCVLALEL